MVCYWGDHLIWMVGNKMRIRGLMGMRKCNCKISQVQQSQRVVFESEVKVKTARVFEICDLSNFSGELLFRIRMHFHVFINIVDFFKRIEKWL